jgi:hypothetical protein
VFEETNIVKEKYSCQRGSNSRLDYETLTRFELGRVCALVQLRDCLTEVLDVTALDHGVYQASYLLETMRRLLADENTEMDLQGTLAPNLLMNRITDSTRLCF